MRKGLIQRYGDGFDEGMESKLRSSLGRKGEELGDSPTWK
jgi:hypothetical protein